MFRSESAPVYEAAKAWTERCLLDGGSVFSEERLWTAENVRQLNADFVENLLTDDRSFMDKLHEQLAPSPPEVKRLASEMLWLMMLFPNNVGVETKIRLVETAHEWSGAPLRVGVQILLKALAQGIGATGQAYNQHRWRELTLLVRAMVAWYELPHSARISLLADGWQFAAWLDKVPDANKRQLRNILLHLIFPQVFERISSTPHKRLIVRHFGAKFGIPLPSESDSLLVDAFDRPLAAVRERLEAEEPGRTVDFYDPGIAAQWLPSVAKKLPPSAKKRAPRPGQTVSPPEPPALEQRLEPGLREVVQIHANLVAVIPELRERVTLGLLVSALIRSVEEDRLDTGRALWDHIRGALPPDANSVLLRFKLPYDQVTESVYASPGEVDVDALLDADASGQVCRVLERADACAMAVSGDSAPEVSTRHLIAAILQPGQTNEAKRALGELGHHPDRLRAALMRFFERKLVEDELASWREYLDVPEPPPVLAEPGFARDYIDPEDTTVAPDHLGVDADVQALARLLCAKTVEPPLSVGLFADWGTGKSTFMQRLKSSIGVLSRRAEEAEARGVSTAYQSGVVPIWFNSWQYMDANLWASLVTHLFDSLAKHLSGDAGANALEEMRKSLYGRLAASQGLLKEAEGRETLAQAEVTAAGERLSAAQAQQAGVTRRIARARNLAAGVWKAIAAEPGVGAAQPAPGAPAAGAAPTTSAAPATSAAASPPAEAAVQSAAAKAADDALASVAGEVKAAVGKAAKELGIPDAQATVGEIRGRLAQMRGLWGNVSASAEILHRQEGRAGDVLLILLAALVLAATLIPAILYFDWNDVRAWITAAGGCLVSLVPVLSVLAAVAAKVRRVLERADAEIRAAAVRANAEADALQRELDRLGQAAAEAERDRVQAQQKVDQVKSEIEDIKAGRRLEQFIRDRAGSDDYRRHLGIIATIRRDFGMLAALLDQVRREGAQPKPAPNAESGALAAAPAPSTPAPAVRRIVLYIDDLDRCPEERVVEVLQAVHLLLAFPLFVVVVGVDSRWLLRAVQSQYERLLTGERNAAQAGVPTDDAAHWASTPQNYLEKIFQIPFTLEPMDAKGFERLLGSLILVRAPVVVPGTGGAAQGGGDAGGASDGADAGGAQLAHDAEVTGGESPPSGLDEQWLDEENEDEEDDSGGEDEDAGLNPPGLEVEAWELAYLSALAPLIGSPRMAKRFANVYRFIRAALSGPALAEFTGTHEQPGTFRAVSLLLALLTGFPGEAVELFRRLLAGDPTPDEDWPAFVRRVAAEAPGAAEPARIPGLPARRWDRMLAALEQLDESVGMMGEMEPYARWAPRVARFSFHTGQIFARRAAAAPSDPPAKLPIKIPIPG